MAAKTSEKATLSVGGQNFEDWESVWVQHTWGDSFTQFKFTCAERDTGQVAQQFKPGDKCTIKLAGEKVLDGYILTRQVAADAYHHAVMLSGVSKTWSAARTSIVHKTSSFDDKDFLTIAGEVLEPTGIGYTTDGNIDKEKFKHEQVQPGEPLFHFLDRLARKRKIIVTCTDEGDFLFVGEGRDSSSQGQLNEGENILKMQVVISNQMQWSKMIVRNQSQGHDGHNMEIAASQEAHADSILPVYSVKIIPEEDPEYQQEKVQKRVDNESMWTEAQKIQATIVVQGWKPGGPDGGGSVWKAGKDVKVKSHMALIDMALSVQQVTYEQDSKRGSITTLVLVAPWGLNGTSRFMVGSPPPPKQATLTPSGGAQSLTPSFE